MIRNRPQSLLSSPYYKGLPPLPFELLLEHVPGIVKLALLPLRHVEPWTADLAAADNNIISDFPSEQEMAFYLDQGSVFQLVFVVVNSVFRRSIDGVSCLLPYAVSLIPASKRGEVGKAGPDFVASMRGMNMFNKGSAYLGMDPFRGEWSLFSQIDLITEMGAKSAFTDELGLVYDYYFLREGVSLDSVAQPMADLPDAMKRRYFKHRAKLLYTPFSCLKARQVWGIENALELFVYQELNRRLAPVPIPQALIFKDGTWFPSLYNAWQEFSGNLGSDLVSEVDFFFPEQRIAIFCDGSTHRRKSISERDGRITDQLKELGIISFRLPVNRILANVQTAVGEFASLL